MTARKAPTVRQRDYAWARFGGCCARKWSPHCVGDLTGKPFEWDHDLELALGGDNSDDQWGPCCRPCHKAKSRVRVGMARKADRQALRKGPQAKREKRKLEGAKSALQSKGFTAWRGMDGTLRVKKDKKTDET